MSESGLLTCSRYAFAPNFYHYCGPDKNRTLTDYLKVSHTDRGLAELLADFDTLHPYLEFISQKNKIANPFNYRVVEAYWLGNELFENIKTKDFYQFIKEKLGKKISKHNLELIYPKLDQEARVNHAFHVLNIYRRTGHLNIKHTLQTMDNCRIGWGKVISLDVDKIIIKTNPLTFKNNQLILGKPIEKQISDMFNLPLTFQPGDWVSHHWGFVCEKLTLRQVRNLYYYTRMAINALSK